MTTELPVDATSAEPAAAAFVRRFEEAWAQSNADALLVLLTDDVVLKQPALPHTVGKPAASKVFEHLFKAFPGLHATVHRWAAQGDIVFIEFTLSTQFAGRPLSWAAVDRFVLRDGLGAERISYFDGGKLLLDILSRPRGWRQVLASGLRPKL